MKKIESIKEFDGFLERYQHSSTVCNCEMTFSVYLPPQAQTQKVPVLYWLSGLTCTDDNFRTKAGAQRYAAQHGIAIVIPDTSPRGADVPDFPDRYDLGISAGFYVNATQPTWSTNYNMYDYIMQELPALVEQNCPIIAHKKSISGHSMGGHGALICALRNPNTFQSVSAFAPICNPTQVPWGATIFTHYLGSDQTNWRKYDAVCLIEDGAKVKLLIDQGTNDEFLQQLSTQKLIDTTNQHNIQAQIRMQTGYDHSFHFVGTFLGEHIAYHAQHLKK